MRSLYSTIFILLFFQFGCVHTSLAQNPVPPNATIPTTLKTCMQDLERQKLRSEELQRIVAEDQDDRKARPIDWNKVYPRDVARIKRVGEIYGEGCIISAKDYAAAALVFQHGDHPDHYLQTYLWQKRAIELGDTADHPDLMLAALDRYLVAIGYKQLFATQYGKEGSENCRCLQPVEESFPEKRRIEMGGMTIQKALEFVTEGNVGRPACSKVTFCSTALKATTKGALPFKGIW